jgi:hypothetical protein
MARSQRHKVIIQGVDAAGKGVAEKQAAPVYIQQYLASQAFTVPLGPPSGPLKGSSLAGFPPTLIPAPGMVEAREAELHAAGEFSDPDQFNLSGNPTYQDLPPAAAGPGPTPPDPALKPVLNSINPSSAKIGDPDLTMNVNGSKFVDGSVIYFNNGAEETTFISDNQLSTIIKPSTATTAGDYPVLVVNPDGQGTDAQKMFTFTDPVAERQLPERVFPIGPIVINSIEDHEDGIRLNLSEGDVRPGDQVLIEATSNTSINGSYQVLAVLEVHGAAGSDIVVDNNFELLAPIEGKGRLTVTGGT